MNRSAISGENLSNQINPEYKLGSNTIFTIAFPLLNVKTNRICVVNEKMLIQLEYSSLNLFKNEKM
jgi:hypothetical protein